METSITGGCDASDVEFFG